jgi:hypothetical protein
LISDGIGPSDQMSGWCHRALVTVNHWFSAICVTYGIVYNGSNLNLPIHSGPQLNQSRHFNKLQSEFDISHHVLEGWEDDFRCLEIMDTKDFNASDEIARHETDAVIQSGKQEKGVQTRDSA